MFSSGSENSNPGNGKGSRTKPRMSFSAQLELIQKSFAEKGSAVESLRKLRDLIEGIPKQTDREKGAVYAFKDLLTVFGELEDGDRKEDELHLQALLEALRYLIGVCREAVDGIRCHFVLRIYNLVVKFSGTVDKRHILVQCACLLEDCHWAEEHTELLLRVSRVVLKAIYDAHTKKQTDQQKLILSGLDVICSTTIRLLRHWSESDELAIRAKAVGIYNDVFDNSTALLYRLFSVDQKRAAKFFASVIDVFGTKTKFSEMEMAELFHKSLPYLEIILSLGEASKQYIQFVEILSIFERIESEPTASSVWILRKYLNFQNSSVLDMKTLESLSEKLKILSGKSPPDQLLVEIVIFITLQLRIHLDQIKQQASELAEPIIELCKSLVKFSKYCPRNHAQICSRCGSSSRHFVDYISTMVINLAMTMSKAGQEISPELVGLVNGFLRHKMLTLDDLGCEKKQSLLDSGLRFLVNWIRVAVQLVPGKEMLDLARLVVDFKYKYGFDFLTDSYLIRLVENCLKDAGVCSAAIDIKLVKLLAALRDGADDSKDVDETIYAIVNFQLSTNNEPIRDLNIVELIERPEMDRFGFPIDPTLTRQEKASILLVEINLASRYKNSNVLQYFQLLQDLKADPLRLGMVIYLLQDGGFPQLSQSDVEVLKTKILHTRPKNPADKVRRHGALGLLSYYAFSATSKATINKLKEAQLNRETIKNDQINNVLKENTMEHELILLTQLEDTYTNFREMVSVLAESSFQHFGLIYSLNQISSMLDNTCRFFVINYYPQRAVETQLLNYLLVCRKPDRILELCCSLGFIIENHQIYNHLLSNRHYNKPWVPTLQALVEKATEIMNTHQKNFSAIPESRKYHFLNLYLSLSQYEASRQNLTNSIVHLQNLTSLLDKCPPSCPITSIARGRIYHTLFRLVTIYNLPTPRGMSPRNFIRLMLAHYNEMQKLPAEHGFIVSTSTLEMTVETLHFLTLRYDTDRLEAHVEQLMRFVLRRGAGLRAMQLMTLYAAMSADSEKEDKCRMLLTYLDRLLMFRPLEKDGKNLPKESTPTMTLEVPLISLSDDPNSQDPTRKAVKYVKSPTKRSPSPRLFPDQAVDCHQYLIEHHTGCSCQFCRYPQYKCQALLVAVSYARLAFIKGQSSRCQEIYETLAEHWRLRKKDFQDSCLIGQRDEFTALVARAFLCYGHFLTKIGQPEQARREYDKSLEILKDVPHVDLGLIEEVQMNLETLEDLRSFNEPGKVESKFSNFEDFVRENPRVHALPSVELGRICSFTPKVGTTRLIPKTASRADDLLKQVARKRLKTTLAKDYSKESELISAMSGLSCASERKPKTVNVFVDTPEKPAVPQGKKKLFTQETSSEDSPKKRGRRKKAEGETPAAPKSTRKKRIPLSPSLKTSSSNESFKDILAKCSTPVSKIVSYGNKGRTTASKRPKITSAFPKLPDGESGSPEMVQNHSFNSSFRDVLMQSLTEDASKRVAKDSSVIILDDSEPDIVNTSLAQNHSVDTSNGCLSLKKYSNRKVASTRTKLIAKTRLQFDTSAVIDITTPDQSPCIVRGVGSSGGGGGIVEVVKRTRGRPRGCRTAASSSSKTSTTTEVTPETSEVPAPKTTRKKVRGRKGE
ncbi:uncharacterized protein LOC135704141 [Ochlerotatus camptorhynchus]|uniref:uncharacterized protein LOC135704141 n=1 Tax=Ochlerotatus camptorhynchus TaxID=644619 RepID=UPI0031E46321